MKHISRLLYIIMFIICMELLASNSSIFHIANITMIAVISMYMLNDIRKIDNRSRMWLFIIGSFIIKIIREIGFLMNIEIISNILFTFSNICLMIGLVFYILDMYKHWYKEQLIVDSIKIIAVFLMIFFALSLSEKYHIGNLGNYNYITIIIVALNLIIVFITSSIGFIAYSSLRTNKFSGIIYLMGLFFIINSVSIFLGIENLLNEGRIITTNYYINELLQLIIVGFSTSILGGFKYVYNKNITNVGRTYTHIFFSVLLLIMYKLNIMEFSYFIITVFVIYIFEILDYYIEKAFLNKEIASKEATVNKRLEKIVKQRTEEVFEGMTKDLVTGLYNRKYFIEYLSDLIKSGKNNFCVLRVDLCKFSNINEIHGHLAGDKIINEISSRLKQKTSEKNVCARIDGDEFAIIYDSFENENSKILESLNDLIVDIFEKPININGYEYNIVSRKSIVRFPEDANNVEDIFKIGDISLNCRFYSVIDAVKLSKKYNKKIRRKQYIESLLKNADISKDFELYFQPQIDIKCEKLIGCEALLRWKHEKEGYISPAEFIPIAEETNIITPLTEWIINEALMVIKSWKLLYDSNISININVSPRSFDYKNFIPNFTKLVKKSGVNPNNIGIEITEYSAVNTSVSANNFMTKLKELGIKLSIDDFGTGYSCLSYITNFNVDELKIAKELVDNITESAKEKIVVQSIVAIAKYMGFKTLVEGIETKEQLDCIKSLGCDIVQGYYYSKPLKREDFEKIYLKTLDK